MTSGNSRLYNWHRQAPSTTRQAPSTTRQVPCTTLMTSTGHNTTPCTVTSTLAECTGSVCTLSSTIYNIWCDNYIQVDCHAEIRYLRQNYSSLRSKVQALLFVALQAWQRQFCFEWMHQSNASQERVTATSGIWKGAKQAAMSYKTRNIVLQNKRRFHHWRRRHCRTACAILQQQENKQRASFCFGRSASLHHSCTFS